MEFGFFSLAQPVDWIAAAKAIGEHLRKSARRTVDGTPVWLKPAPSSPAAEIEQKPQPLGPHLYAGSSGIILFLAALGHVLEEDEYRTVAISALTPVRRRLAALVADSATATNLQLRLGGVIGLGALIYSLVRLSGWLAEPVLLEEACGVATLLTPERIAADDTHELMYGSAGALLGLLLLDREALAPWRDRVQPLARAVACGEHLLRRRLSRNGDPRAWPFNGRPPTAGFAHGASGIAYALARLAVRCGRDDFRQAAFEGLEYERLHYCPEQRNWRGTAEKPNLTAWCSGAPGIALSRLEILHLLDSPAPDGPRSIQDELLLALETTHSAAEADFDFLCCGNMGRVETLLQASRRLGREDLLQRAQEMAARVAARAPGHWFGPGAEGSNPSFFRGAAGIGYGFLRLSGHPSLPCVLTLE
ncbi:MAG: hypothetical protein QOF89_3763 [Acidobacteriota bacterium]|jgi:lantibiotic modifying enzyme|nr:hypothetical protein [Acidobacteriota bacterium]